MAGKTSKRRTWVAAGIGAIVGGAGLLYAALGSHGDGAGGTAGGNPPGIAGDPGGALTANVSLLLRDGAGQAELAGQLADGTTRAFHTGDLVPAGATLRTDERTRARLSLSDGSTVTVQQDSELRLNGETARSLQLVRGELLADVAHLANGPRAVVTTPLGEVEVLGTKLAITADASHASVRVTRGSVRVKGTSGDAVSVEAGQEAVLRQNAAPSVLAAVGLASSLGWSDLDQDTSATDVPIAGLGELRAHRPGERETQDRPLQLSNHAVTVRIAGHVARTEIEETFRNDGPDTLEGVYKFPLPPGARIASLALLVDGRWEEGAFVEREEARQIWRGVIRNATPERPEIQEEWIWVPGPWRDPALLEWQQGGRVELRIFPIPARGERQVKIVYEQSVEPFGLGRRYVYPLAHASDGSTNVGHFQVDMRVQAREGAAAPEARGYEMRPERDGNAWALRYSADGFSPHGDIVVDFPEGSREELRAFAFAGDFVSAAAPSRRSRPEVVEAMRSVAADTRPYVALVLRPELPASAVARRKDFVFVVDASQSMVGERFTRASRVVTSMVAEMDRRDRYVVLACDAQCREVQATPDVAGPTAGLEKAFEQIEPAGASDVVAALRAGSEAIPEADRKDHDLYVVYVGDGTATSGPSRPATVAAAVESLRQRSEARFVTIGIGQDADSATLATVARAGGGHHVRFVPGQHVRAVALAALESTFGSALLDPKVDLPAGITDVAPAALPTIRAGEEVLVVGRFSGDVAGDVVLRGELGGESFERRYALRLAPTTAAGNAFVPRLFAQTAIEDLELAGRNEDTARVVALSKAYGVMSSRTSLLVLESEAMFRAFGLDRGQPRVTFTGEEESEAQVGVAADAPDGRDSDRDDASQMGALGSLGGRSGMGFGSGGGDFERAPMRRAGPPPASAPAARMAEAAAAPAEAFDAVEESRSRRAEPAMVAPPMPRGRGEWMHKVWHREATVQRNAFARAVDQQKVLEAQIAVNERPDSRDRHRELVRALSRAGELERALEAARAWLARDRLDPEALTYVSDVLGRLGRRDEALRVLSGVVDLAPEDLAQQRRLVMAFERAGLSERACAHRLALAERHSDETSEVGAALRCLGALGQTTIAEKLLASLPDGARAQASAAALRPVSLDGANGDLLVEARWQGGDDVDLTLVTPQGTRLSWMGGRVNVVADGAMRPGQETLGLKRAGVGSYVVEVSRTRTGGGMPIRGELTIRSLGENVRVPFELVGDHTAVARVDVVRRWTLQAGAGPGQVWR